MHTTLTLRSEVLLAKDWLGTERAKLRQQHADGSPGIQVCACLADMLDQVVLRLYEGAVAEVDPDGEMLPSEVALVSHGGYGRRDVAPYSDVDLMILHSGAASDAVASLAKRLLRDLCDVGLTLGASVRTPGEACRLAFKDSTIFTSLSESRYLAGSAALFARFTSRFQRRAGRRWRGTLSAMQIARHKERAQYGETVFLLEPNVKRSPGALRDIQLLRWAGFARFGQTDPEALQRMGRLSQEDRRTLRRASEFLLRLRNELHFQAGKSHDVLDRVEQVRLAEWSGMPGGDGLMPVEHFMREYFRHTSNVSRVVGRFLASVQPWRRLAAMFAPLVTHQVEGDFRVGPHRISATGRGLTKIRGDLAELLRLADLANLYDKQVDPATWAAVHDAVPQVPAVVSSEGAGRFLSLLSQPGRLGELLRSLHDLGALEKIIPAFAHARCLLQFNEYHKFTVDEHCIRAVEQAIEFLHDPAALGEVYRALKQKRTLHLALLIHDLGKGHVEDHSEIGLQIADDTARRLRLPEREAESLRFLVHKHLLMSHLAFRRDTSDDQLIVRFAVEVGSAEVLRMLFVLTAADLAAVGPGVWNGWKAEVLTDLYHRTMRHLTGDSPSQFADERRAAVRAQFAVDEKTAWYFDQIDALPSSYLLGAPAEKIADELRKLRPLESGDVQTWSRYLPDSDTVEYTVGTYEDITPGVFHKLTGALTGQGLQILSADINTLADGLVLDRFLVHDPDYAGEPSSDRMAAVNARLAEALRAAGPPAFRRVWGAANRKPDDGLNVFPTRVRIDNSTSERCTILDIFARDQMGLLYTIARTLYELGLSVSLAKIGTYLDQVVDVFYVTDQQGRKIEDEHRLQTIRTRLLEAIDQLEREPI